MLSKAHRLTKQTDFSRLARQGRPFYSSLFTTKVKANDLTVSRFGLVISKKISKKAVERNRLKRQLAELIRLNLDDIKPGLDFMILVKAAALGKDYLQLEADFLQLIKKAKLNV
ncbi:MAG: ribonuclease P protein component [Candidatus Komeilibacteria bacterium CG10_big_fil_rev_8_21_14_0_10_41_13]|uniref:Ribonuclease P protein component n=1 Tax=Candidatus Komeilibacteria bacterium CG10_big_fil_rev_8_21_14_0_10_41_13 TaxID=1974476 RepID=A0A2M6WCW6_9BACT|nr:MAG: ribonuclease P protein component [Candidatus Komeilibacteria bacterium CG10_big_fil_rev_8_21_14_0_10_41_13]